MEQRKNPKKDLRNKSGLFFQIGLLIAMGLAVSAFEFRAIDMAEPITVLDVTNVDDPIIPITEIEQPKPPKPVIAKPVEVLDEEIIDDIDDESIFDIGGIPTDIPEPMVVDEPEEVVEEFVDYAEVAPTPVGGYAAFYKFVSKNIKYPDQARRRGLGGKVFVRFVINTKGEVTKIETVKGVGYGLDEEAMRVLGQSPAWNPGKQGGRKLNVRMIIPITFEIGR